MSLLPRPAGVSLQEMVGKNDLDIWPLDLAKKYRADDQEVMRTGNRKCFEEPLINSEKRTIWIETIKTPILDDKQEVIGTTGIARDITPRRQMEEALRESETKYRLLAENARDCIWRMDLNQRITYASPAVQLLTGFTPEEFLTLRIGPNPDPGFFPGGPGKPRPTPGDRTPGKTPVAPFRHPGGRASPQGRRHYLDRGPGHPHAGPPGRDHGADGGLPGHH